MTDKALPHNQAIALIDTMLSDYCNLSIVAAGELSDRLLDVRLLLEQAKKDYEEIQQEVGTVLIDELATPVVV